MPDVNIDLGESAVTGTCDDAFTAVRDAFVQNFRERDEIGASVCITAGGKPVVDLWGGLAHRPDKQPWERDTVTTVFSCTKGATAICAHTLASRGQLDYDAPVAEYWPEFAKNGKEAATVRMMLNHSVGVPAWREKLKPQACIDWEYMVRRLEEEEPWWKPGTRNGYHMISFGWTVGELVRRVSGRSLGTFFREEVAEPLGIDFHIGARPEIESRFAKIVPFTPAPDDRPGAFGQAILGDRESLQAKALFNGGNFDANSPECHAAEIGGAGGLGNGRSLAAMYAPFACGGELQGVKLVDSDTLTRMGLVSMATEEDATLLIPTRFSLGFMKSIDNRTRRRHDADSAIFSDAAFGHVGAGGSLGLADPVEKMSFGYAMNRQGQGILLNERGQSLVDATYRSLGYRTNAGGVWVK